jgi:hypothetical protein
MQRFIVTVHQFEATEDGADAIVAAFGPFTVAEMNAFTRQNMGALASGYYWEFTALHTNCNELSHMFIPGTRNNPNKG